jgi:hypothetical protein
VQNYNEVLVMNRFSELTPGLQCCLRCGRILTDRALHDGLEEPALDSIRISHPEWASGAGVDCQPCVNEYRRLLGDRLIRFESVGEDVAKTWLPARVGKLLGRIRGSFSTVPVS